MSALPPEARSDAQTSGTPDADTHALDPDPGTDPTLVLASPRAVLTGVLIGPAGDHPVCTGCQQVLREGQAIAVYAYQPDDERDIEVARSYCPECSPDRIVGPTLGATELLARARVGTRSQPARRTHRFCLTAVAVVAVSPPTEGTRQ